MGSDSRWAVVTGGAGFIGQHLVARLLQHQWDVTIVDDGSGADLDQCIQFLRIGSKMGKTGKWELIKGSILDQAAWAKVHNSHLRNQCPVVFHLAACVEIERSLREPDVFDRVNIEGTEVTLDHSRKLGAGLVVFASSAAVYGAVDHAHQSKESDVKPTTESVGLNPYGRTKLAGEHLVTQSGLKHVVFRFFNVYGPGQSSHSNYPAVVPAMQRSAKKLGEVLIYGDGHQCRDFVHVDQLTQVLEMAATWSNMPAFEDGSILNLGTTVATEILQVARIIAAHYKVPIHFREAREDDVCFSAADNHKLMQLLGSNWAWTEFTVSLQNMLEQMR